MTHKHEWMASSVGGVYLAICNAGDGDCEAELTANEIDSRLNATEELSAEEAERLGKALREADVYGLELMLEENDRVALRAYAERMSDEQEDDAVEKRT